ncbi:MAG: outer membrane protein [Gemmatimonadaceae bacterium]
MRSACSTLALAAPALLALAFAAESTEAQQLRLIRIGVTGGWSRAHDFAGNDQIGTSAQLSVSVRPGVERFELRGDFAHYWFDGPPTGPCLAIGDACPAVRDRDRIASAVLNGNVYPLRHSITPYAGAGVGFYRLKSTRTIVLPSICDGRPCGILAAAILTPSSQPITSTVYQSSFGVNAGGGVSFAVDGLSLFAEARYHRLYLDGKDRSMVPVSVGVMF